MMLDLNKVDQIYLVCGKTDLRKGIDGLVGVVTEQFELDPYRRTLFLFCGTRKDRFKALLWEGDGFLLLYKRFENGSLQWPLDQAAVRKLTSFQLKR
ncbi:IS66 family insertion sequence element accessory protein TnpB, partial [Ligilactobacillus acidipiscis]